MNHVAAAQPEQWTPSLLLFDGFNFDDLVSFDFYIC